MSVMSKQMTKKEFILLMSFPDEWLEWDMFPDTLATLQIKEYRKGHEESAEHTRFGAFNWWIAYVEKPEQLINLIKLSYLDKDQGMAADARDRIAKLDMYDLSMDVNL